MKIFKEENFIRGWLIGGFSPSIINTDTCEVAVKRYKSGDYEESHYHKIATEITAIISGSVKMNNQIYTAGDIIVIEPNESTDFLAIEDAVSVVVKIPGAKDDKYLS